MTRFPQTLCFGDIGKAKIAEIMIWIKWEQRLQQSLRVLLPNAPSLCFGNFGKAKMLRTVTWIFIENLKLPQPLRLLLPNAPSARGPGKHVLVLQQSNYEKRKCWDYNCKQRLHSHLRKNKDFEKLMRQSWQKWIDYQRFLGIVFDNPCKMALLNCFRKSISWRMSVMARQSGNLGARWSNIQGG